MDYPIYGDVFEQLRIFWFVFDCWFRCLFICSYFNENSLYVFVMTSLRTTIIIWPKLTGERVWTCTHTHLPAYKRPLHAVHRNKPILCYSGNRWYPPSFPKELTSQQMCKCVCPTNNHIFILHSLEFHIQIPQQLAPNWKKPQFEHSNKLCADQSSQ